MLPSAMNSGDIAGASAPEYDKLPLRAEDVAVNEPQLEAERMGSPGEEGKVNALGYKESLEELQNVVKLLESERYQMNQRQEVLVDQHAKIDYSLQVILEEIAALKAQAAQESDLNILMVQFIVMSVRLLVEAAFSKEKEELIPALEAELQRLELPARHPKLLACFNRLRSVCGKAPLLQKDLASMSVVVSPAPSGAIVAAEIEIVPGRSASGTSLHESSGPPTPELSERQLSVPAATKTSLVDESDDEKVVSASVGGEFPGVVVHEGASSPARIQVSRLAASADFSSRRESLFTPGERRRTATAIGDGDLPLFQQFAVAGAAPAPDDFVGLRKPMDTATLSMSPKSVPLDEGPIPGSPGAQQSEANRSGSFRGTGSREVEECTSGQAEVLEEWAPQGKQGRNKAGPKETAETPMPETAAVNTLASSSSIEGLVNLSSTILSMPTADLRAMLLRAASVKDDSGSKTNGERACPPMASAEMAPASRLDSEGPPAPMPSIVKSASKEHLQLLQDAMEVVARVAAGELRDQYDENSNPQSVGKARPKPNEAGEELPSIGKVEAGVRAREQPVAAQEEAAQGYPPQRANSGKTLLPYPAVQNERADAIPTPTIGSPFSGRIAPPSTPDAMAHTLGDYTSNANSPQAASHSLGLYLPADQSSWQQFFNNAAASERHRKDQALLEIQAMAQGAWGPRGTGPYAYQPPPQFVVGPAQGAPMGPEIAAARGFGYIGPNGAVGTRSHGGLNVYCAKAVPMPIPAVKIARPKGQENLNVGLPRVESRANGRYPQSHTHAFSTTRGESQDLAFETPRVEGGWVCCRRVPVEGKKGRKQHNR